MIATSASRVATHTGRDAARALDAQAGDRLASFADHPAEIARRLRELDAEWDVERTLAVSSAALSFTGAVLGSIGSRKELLIPLVVQGFFLQHALQGWCPPPHILRRMGFGTPYEIERERSALKALRGDFAQAKPNRPEAALRAAR